MTGITTNNRRVQYQMATLLCFSMILYLGYQIGREIATHRFQKDYADEKRSKAFVDYCQGKRDTPEPTDDD